MTPLTVPYQSLPQSDLASLAPAPLPSPVQAAAAPAIAAASPPPVRAGAASATATVTAAAPMVVMAPAAAGPLPPAGAVMERDSRVGKVALPAIPKGKCVCPVYYLLCPWSDATSSAGNQVTIKSGTPWGSFIQPIVNSIDIHPKEGWKYRGEQPTAGSINGHFLIVFSNDHVWGYCEEGKKEGLWVVDNVKASRECCFPCGPTTLLHYRNDVLIRKDSCCCMCWDWTRTCDPTAPYPV